MGYHTGADSAWLMISLTLEAGVSPPGLSSPKVNPSRHPLVISIMKNPLSGKGRSGGFSYIL